MSIYAGVTVIALATGGLAAKVLSDEYRSFRNIETDGNTAFLKLRHNADLSFAPWAILTQTAVLEMCNNALIAPISSVVAPDVYAGIATRCRDTAQEITRQVPAWGLSRFSEARAAAALGDIPAAQTALELSARLAPNEGWIAQKRVLLMLDLPETAALDTLFVRDLTLLLSTQTSRQWVAQLFVARPDHQDRIASAVETTPNDTQRRFLSDLRRLNRTGA